jgi:flagellar hook-basal body complex protein FliE
MDMLGGISPVDRVIQGIQPLVPKAAQEALGAEGSPFVQELRKAVDQMIDLQNDAEHMQQELAAGRVTDINEVVLAVQKADLALNFALELRNKVVEAYQEVSRMQL